ncbi:GAF domain-containing SpoIIE family protein phosphatase [Balneola sp. MJW-20]|uniref:GAF domain-containing SpoIIE family protein phosphatase n=1 Tax=Gracilimonas aurantiaca TaxID=3234185 RepID=UPI003467798D
MTGSHSDQQTRQLQVAVNELTVLNDIATTISSMQPVEEIIDQIIMKCIKHLAVEEGTISLLEKESPDQAFMTMIRRQDTTADRLPIKLDTKLTGWMLRNRSILLSNDIHDDDRFQFMKDDESEFQSILSVPLIVKNDLIGYLAVFNKKNTDGFTDEDKRLLSIIGSQSAQVIENARLYEEEKALLSLQEEMKMAKNIQLNLLPKSNPELKGYEVAALNIPAKSVGGDYYDFILLDSGKTGFCVGDITGKGMPAAMLMANLQATLRSQCTIFEDPGTCLKGTNKQLHRSTEATKFATLFYGVLDQENGTLEYANGGHDAPLLYRKNDPVKELNATGLLLGVMPESDYTIGRIELEPGDLLALYTDGITEAMDKAGNEYGFDRLKTQLSGMAHESAETIKEGLLKDLKSHTGEAAQSDDITLMLIKRTT